MELNRRRSSMPPIPAQADMGWIAINQSNRSSAWSMIPTSVQWFFEKVMLRQQPRAG
jgi:hypothetical protein